MTRGRLQHMFVPSSNLRALRGRDGKFVETGTDFWGRKIRRLIILVKGFELGSGDEGSNECVVMCYIQP